MHLLYMIESNILFTNRQFFSEPSWEFWLVEWSNIRNHDEILITAGDNIFMMYFAMSHDAEVYWLVHAELGWKQFVVIESYICTSIKCVITFNTHTSMNSYFCLRIWMIIISYGAFMHLKVKYIHSFLLFMRHLNIRIKYYSM